MNWRLKDSDIFLQKKNGDNIDLLRHRDLDYHCYSNQFNEISFVVDRPSVDKQSEDNAEEDISNELKTYDLILDEQIVYIPELGHFCISVDLESDGNESKTVSGKSWEYELSRKYLQDFQANTMEEGDATDSNGDFITTVLFDESNRDRSLLHRVLKDTGWSIRRKYDTEKYVAMSAEVRTYDIQWQDVYSFLSDLQNELDIVFEYDKYERIITWCLLEDYGKDTGVFITLDNLAKKIDVTTDESKLFTEVVIHGGDGIDVNQVIPAYTNSIFKPDYFLDEKYMSRDAIDAYNYYRDYYNSVVDTYPNYMIEADEYNEKYLRYLNAKPLSETIETGTKEGTIKYLDEMTESELDAAFTWNEDSEYNYGRNHLSQIIDSYTEAKETLDANSSDQGQEYYNHILLVIKVAKSHLGIIDLKISDAKTKRDSASSEASAIKQSCDLRIQFRKYFSEVKGLSGYDLDVSVEKAYQEINSFRFPTEYSNENYIITDDEASDYSTVLKYTKELIARAEKELDSSCVPYITWKCDVIDLKDMDEFSELLSRDDFDTGDFIWVELHEGFYAKVRITEYSYTHEDPDSFSIEFADRIETSDVIADVAERIGAATSVASQMEYYTKQMSAYDETYRNMREIIDYGLDASKTMIYNNVGQEVITDEYGILGRKQIAGNIYSPEQVRLQSNQLIFTDDNWETVRTALGKIAMRTENGVEYKYGLIADTILVEDLYSLNADIGKWKIGADALYSKNFAINEDGTIASGLYLGSDGKFLAKYLQMSEDVFNLNVAGVRITAGDKNVSWNDYIGDINQQNKDYVDGVQGGNIAAIEVEYYLSSSTSLLEGGTWSTVAPEWQEGMYMWQRTKTVYKNGAVEYSDPTCIAGASGKDGTDGNGVKSVTRYYILQSSAPSKPTTNPPDGWTTTEPTYTSGSTDSLYFCDLTTFSDDTWNYSSVSKSSSYEAAKEAWNKAQNAQEAADDAAKVATNYMNFDETDGLVVGNMTADTLGNNVRIDNDSVDIRSGSNVLATFAANVISLGRAAVNAVIELCGGVGKIIAKKDPDFEDSSLFNKVLMLSKFFQFRSREIWFDTVNRNDFALSDDDVPTLYSSDAFTGLYMRSQDGEANGTSSASIRAYVLNGNNNHKSSIELYGGNVDGTTSGYARIEASNGSTTSAYVFGADEFESSKSIKLNSTKRGYYLVDSSGASYPGVYDNGGNLWIGSIGTIATHHKGGTYISSGHNGASGNTTIYITVPNAANTDGTNYGVFHTGYLDVGKATNGTLPIARGGTDGTTAATARTNLGVMGAVNANGYYGLARPSDNNTTDWIRTTSNGLIPYKSGGGSSALGTSNWPFSKVYSANYYKDGDILLFSGQVLYQGNLAADGSFTTTKYKSYKCFVAILSDWHYAIGYRWDVNAGISMGGQYDGGPTEGSWAVKASFSVSFVDTTATLKLVGASKHKLLASGTSHSGSTLNVLYVLGIF